MATSGDKTISVVGDEIIKMGLRRMRKLVPGESIPAEDMNRARETFNAMITEWLSQGARIWTKKQITLFLTPGTKNYTLHGEANAMLTDDLIEQTVDGDVTAPSSTIDVASSTGISSGDNVLIIISATEVHSTTVNGAPSGNTVTLTDALSSDVSDGAAVYFWTTSLAVKPMRLQFAMHENASGDEQQVWLHTREDYLRQTNKAEQGVPVKLYYDSGKTTGKLHVWPTGNDYGDRLNLDMMVSFDVQNTATDDVDFPQEWKNCLAWGFASEFGPEKGVPMDRQQLLDTRAAVSLVAMKNYDRNNAPIPIEFEDLDYDDSGGMPLEGFN